MSAMKRKILIIDDEKDLCHFYKLVLEDTGRFDVKTETNSANALVAVKDFGPEMILLDIAMPNMDGGEVEELLKQADISKDIPIIFVSALASTLHNAQEGVQVAGRFVVAKPVTAEGLIGIIDKRLPPLPKP